MSEDGAQKYIAQLLGPGNKIKSYQLQAACLSYIYINSYKKSQNQITYKNCQKGKKNQTHQTKHNSVLLKRERELRLKKKINNMKYSGLVRLCLAKRELKTDLKL